MGMKFEEMKVKKSKDSHNKKVFIESRRSQARKAVSESLKDLESKSLTNFDWRVKEINEMSFKRFVKDKESSLRSYKSFKKKMEND
jgi:hypothetical protein